MRRKGKSRVGWGLVWVLVLAVVVTLVIRQSQVMAVKRRLAQLEKEIQYYSQSNADLQAKITALKNPEYIEKLAREKLGLVKPGEVQYITVNPSEKR